MFEVFSSGRSHADEVTHVVRSRAYSDQKRDQECGRAPRGQYGGVGGHWFHVAI